MNSSSKLLTLIMILYIAGSHSALGQELACGDRLEDSIDSVGEQDTFTFSGQAGDVVIVTLFKISGSSLFVPITDLFGPTPGTEPLSIFTGDETNVLPEDGTYTLRIRDDNLLDTGFYRIELEWISPFDQQCGENLLCGEQEHDSIDSVGEQDVFTFNGQAGNVVTLTLFKTSGSSLFVPIADLFGPTPGTEPLSIFTGDDTNVLPEDGTYTLRIHDDDFSDTGFYGIQLDWVVGACTCAAAEELSCESPVDSRSNDDPGSTQIVDRYPCLTSSYNGRELVYSFSPPTDGNYRLELTDLEADLDLAVIGPGLCSPDLCLASSDVSGVGDESLMFSGTAGAAYFIVVDSTLGVSSTYTIELTCPGQPVASFETAPEFLTAGQQIRFFDTSEGSPDSWTWNFGDGVTAEVQNPRHTYSVSGTYDVALAVGNAVGTDSVAKRIVVAPEGAAIEISGPASGAVDEILTFSASASVCQQDAAGWRWSTAGGEMVSGASADAIRLRWPAGGTKIISAVNSSCGSATGSLAVVIRPRQPPAAPAGPAGLAANPLSATDIRLSWTDNSTIEDGFLIEQQEEDGSFAGIAVVPVNTTSAAVSVAGSPEPTGNPSTFRVKAFNAAGTSVPSNLANTTTTAESCDPATTLCLLGKRFKVEAEWRDFDDNRGLGNPVQLTSDTGYFWFFGPDNVELAIKVLDGQGVNDHFWVFYGALSNVEFTLTVTDTETGNTQVYFNPAGQFASVGDTLALPDGSPAGNFQLFAAKPSAGFHPVPVVPKGPIGVDFDWSPLRPSSGDAALFRDRSQFPPPLLDRTWDFGDGTPRVPTQEIETTHTFIQSGGFDATLEIIDFSGDFQLRETRTRSVQVTPPPEPRLTLRGPSSTDVGTPATFSASADEHCSPLRPRGWSWQVADGRIIGPAGRSTIDVFWPTSGRKTVTVRNAGCSTVSANRRIEVGEGPPPAACVPGPDVLCLRDGRFRVTVTWVDFDGNTGHGRKVRLSNESGQFWFFDEDNVELVLKVADGQALNNHFWVFYGALSNVGFTITVTDTETGNSKRYVNPAGEFVSVGDTSALPGVQWLASSPIRSVAKAGSVSTPPGGENTTPGGVPRRRNPAENG